MVKIRMKASVDRLRWGLVAAALLLLVALGCFLGYGRYKQLRKWKDTLRLFNIHSPHETLGFTYSSSPKDRTSYKIRAARVVQHGDGTWSLYDVVMTLYSKTSKDEDHILAKDVEYDQNTGVATAVGEVHMDLQVPGNVGKGKESTQPALSEEGERVIHIKTSGLVYVRKLDVAATDQPVEFQYAGMRCVSQGAEFESGEGLLHLLSDVVMTGTVDNAPLTVHANKADLDRQNNSIALVHPVAVSLGRTVAAAEAVVHLRKDGSVEQAEGSGGVTLDESTRHMAGDTFAGSFNAASLPVNAKLTGHVVATDSAAMRPMRAQANELDATFDAVGQPATAVAVGAAQVMITERKPGAVDLPRELHGNRIAATFANNGARKSKARLSEIHAIGAASARGLSMTSPTANNPGLRTTVITADDLRAVFDTTSTDKPEVQQVFANGHTRLEQNAPLGEKQVSTADTLQVDFVKAEKSTGAGQPTLQVASAEQTGNVVIHSVPATKPNSKVEAPSDAGAGRSTYDASTAKLMLTGLPHFAQGQTSLSAATIAVNQRTGDAHAEGNVLATITGAPGENSNVSAAAHEPQITHVAADRAELLHASQISDFFGTASQPARLWQGASQVQATTLTFDQKRKSLSARPSPGGQVHAVFVNTSQSAGQKSTAQKAAIEADRVVRISSALMDYDDLHHEATFSGGVRIDGASAQAQSSRGVAFLEPAQNAAEKSDTASPFGGSLRRIVLSDSVRILEPGRTGTGDQLTYTAADGEYVLTGTPGKPPHIVDAQQGSVTGATLVFHGSTGADSTIIVGGTPALGKQGRVRTETEVRGK